MTFSSPWPEVTASVSNLMESTKPDTSVVVIPSATWINACASQGSKEILTRNLVAPVPERDALPISGVAVQRNPTVDCTLPLENSSSAPVDPDRTQKTCAASVRVRAMRRSSAARANTFKASRVHPSRAMTVKDHCCAHERLALATNMSVAPRHSTHGCLTSQFVSPTGKDSILLGQRRSKLTGILSESRR